MLYECPTGKTLRDAPHIYDLIDMLGSFENVTPTEMGRQSRYVTHSYRIYRSETARLTELKNTARQTANDANFGQQTLTARA